MDHSEVRKIELPVQVRAAPVATVNKEARTVEVIWSRGAAVPRFDWWTGERYLEELDLNPASVRMDRMNAGASVLASHNQWDLDAVVGVVERASLDGKEGVATLRFADDEDSDKVFRKVEQKILRFVSVGYIVHRYQKTDAPQAGGLPVWRAIDWEPCEISIVAVPADPGAMVRSAIPPEQLPKVRTFPCEFITPAAAAGSSSTTRNQETTMTDKVNTSVPAADPNAGTQHNVDEVRAAAVKAERDRIADIQSRGAKLGLPAEFVQDLVARGVSPEVAAIAMTDEVARVKAAPAINGAHGGGARVTDDERVKLRAAMSSALTHRVNPRGELPNNGAGDFRYMSLARMAEECLRREGVDVRGLPASQIATRAFHSNSDFANILADASNKRLRQAYEENMPSYTRWARRAPNAPDFKTINVTQLSAAPDLQKVLEGGEFKRGKMTDGKETYQVFTYGRIIGITRQAIVNDDLSAFDRVPRALGAAARRLENTTVYGILTANAAMADTGALFNATAVSTAGGHANLGTGAGSALATGSMTTARTAMRAQVGLAGEKLNVAPAFLIVPAALEQTAYQLTSANYVPATKAEVNEFRAGGRTAVDPIVEALLDASSATAWYFAADPAQIDTVEYCYLDGSEGLYLEQQVGFNVDGIEFKARLDFAAAPIDWRGLYKANGA